MAGFDEQKSRFIDFLRSGNSFSIFYHTDGDGVTSAAILAKAINAMGKDVYAYRPTNYEDFENLDLSEFNNNIIICDMFVKERDLKRFKKYNLCIIDHHELINPGEIVYINPKMWGDDKYTPCSLLMYRLLREYCDDSLWIAAIGVVSDSGGRDNPEFIKEAAKRYDIKLKEDVFLYDNDFGCASSTISAMQIHAGRNGLEDVLDNLLVANSIEELINNPRLKKIRIEIARHFKDITEKFEKEAETSDQFIYFFEINGPKSRYSTSVATALSHTPKYYDKVIVFIRKIGGNNVRFNIRTNDKRIKLPAIFREIFKTIEGEGGGHDPAAGCTVKAEDKDRFISAFKECIYSSLKK